MSFNPLASILKDNKLEGHNYVDWKRNLMIVLVVDNIKFVLEEECSDVPTDNASNAARQPYLKWKKADEMAKCYILASMSNVLQHQHRSKNSAYDIMESLVGLFRIQNRTARQLAMRNLMSVIMVDGTPKREHVLKMMGYLNEIAVLGGNIDAESQNDIILQSLPSCFEHFRLNYGMNKKNYTLAELLTEVQSAKVLMARTRQALMLESQSNSVPKG